MKKFGKVLLERYWILAVKVTMKVMMKRILDNSDLNDEYGEFNAHNQFYILGMILSFVHNNQLHIFKF